MAAIRPAVEGDMPAIRGLMAGERVNPLGVDWRNFLIAETTDGVVGIVQLRPAGPGAVEIGSLVVRAGLRGGGLGRGLVDAAVAAAGARRAFVITAATRAPFFATWGFRPVPALSTPPPVRRNWLLGQAGSLLALAHGMRPRRLAVLERPGSAAGPG